MNDQPFDVPTWEKKLSSLLGHSFWDLFRVRWSKQVTSASVIWYLQNSKRARSWPRPKKSNWKQWTAPVYSFGNSIKFPWFKYQSFNLIRLRDEKWRRRKSYLLKWQLKSCKPHGCKCLPMQGTRVWALVWEDPTCRGAAKPVSHNYWACASGACAPQQERPR